MFFAVLFLLFIGIVAWAQSAHQKKIAAMPSWQREAYLKQQREASARATYGPKNAAMHCPHCQVAGNVHTKQLTQKKGVSGAKATGAILTGGVSLLATGLSRKEQNTQAHCTNCNNTWVF